MKFTDVNPFNKKIGILIMSGDYPIKINIDGSNINLYSYIQNLRNNLISRIKIEIKFSRSKGTPDSDTIKITG